MQLPEDDERYLNDKGFEWELVPASDGVCLVLRGYAVSPGKYDRPATDIMVRIPAQYPMAALDMFYADPPLRFPGGAYPKCAEVFEPHGGRQWQRFSRHLANPWRTGIDGLPNFIPIIAAELQGNGLAG